MTLRERAFALVVLMSTGSVIYGAALFSTAAGFIVAGVLVPALTWLWVSE